MTELEKIMTAIERGYTCDFNTGVVINRYSKVITAKNSQGYTCINLLTNNKNLFIRTHRFIFYFYHNYLPKVIDHINGIRSDNRLCNLREANHQINSFNRLGVKGYSFNKDKKKYISYIKVDGNSIYLGSFDNEDDARNAYLNAKSIYHII